MRGGPCHPQLRARVPKPRESKTGDSVDPNQPRSPIDLGFAILTKDMPATRLQVCDVRSFLGGLKLTSRRNRSWRRVSAGVLHNRLAAALRGTGCVGAARCVTSDVGKGANLDRGNVDPRSQGPRSLSSQGGRSQTSRTEEKGTEAKVCSSV